MLLFCGIPAQQVGNLIYLDGGFVGVDEACSGIRSFQLSIVAAYILGELEWMSWLRRITLLVFGLILAFVINLSRTFALALLFNEGGAELMNEWHDRIGLGTMIAVVVILYLVAELMTKPVDHKTRPAGSALKPIPRGISIGLLSIFAISPIVAEKYYQFNEGDGQPSAALSVTFERIPDRAERIQIPDATKALLRYSSATAFNVPTRDADQMTFYQFHWDKSRISSFSGVHRPEVCLPSAGIELVKTYPDPRTIQMDGLEINFGAYEFEGAGNTLHVYFMVRDERKGQQLPPALTAKDRISQAFRGERIRSRELIEILVVNSINEATAWESAKRLLEPHLSVTVGQKDNTIE
jgi:exosortase/archaeosortase family protein